MDFLNSLGKFHLKILSLARKVFPVVQSRLVRGARDFMDSVTDGKARSRANLSNRRETHGRRGEVAFKYLKVDITARKYAGRLRRLPKNAITVPTYQIYYTSRVRRRFIVNSKSVRNATRYFPFGNSSHTTFKPVSLLNRNMKRRQFIKSTAPVATIGVAGCTSGGSSNGDSGGRNQNEGSGNQEQPPGTRWYDSDTEIGVMEGVEAEMDSIGNMYIRGTAKNFSDSDYSYVQLSFSVVDDTGAKVASGLANTNGLSAGQRWRFEALAASSEGASAYKLTDVTAY